MIRYTYSIHWKISKTFVAITYQSTWNFLCFFVLTMSCHGFLQGGLNVSQRVRRSGDALLTRTPAMPSTGSFKKQPRRTADWKKPTQVFLVYFGQRGVCNKKWDEVWRRACICVGRIWNVVWFVDWRCWRNVHDSFENDLMYTFKATKCPGFWNSISLVWRPWLKRRHQRRSTRTCVKGRHRKHGVPQRFSESAKGGWRWGEREWWFFQTLAVRITKEQALLKEKLLLMEARQVTVVVRDGRVFFLVAPWQWLPGSFTEKVCGIPKKGWECLAMIMWHLTNGWIMSFQGLWWPTMRLKPPILYVQVALQERLMRKGAQSSQVFGPVKFTHKCDGGKWRIVKPALMTDLRIWIYLNKMWSMNEWHLGNWGVLAWLELPSIAFDRKIEM